MSYKTNFVVNIKSLVYACGMSKKQSIQQMYEIIKAVF